MAGRLHGDALHVCRRPFASKQGVVLSATNRYPPVQYASDSLWLPVSSPIRCLTATVSAEVASELLQRRLQTRSAPMKETKELESSKIQPGVASRYIVRSGTAEALAQSSKPATKQKVFDRCLRADRQPAGELMSSLAELGVVRREKMYLEHRRQVHHFVGSPRARGGLLDCC